MPDPVHKGNRRLQTEDEAREVRALLIQGLAFGAVKALTILGCGVMETLRFLAPSFKVRFLVPQPVVHEAEAQ